MEIMKTADKGSCGSIAAGQSPYMRAWVAAYAECRPCLWRTAPMRRYMRLA